LRVALLSMIVAGASGCNSVGSGGPVEDETGGVPTPTPRPPEKTYLGFTPLPPSLAPADQDLVYSRFGADANITAHHFDVGVPWNEALIDTYPYDTHIMRDWGDRLAKTPPSHKIYVAVTPINFERNGLAPYRKNQDNMALVAPFDALGAASDFNNTSVRTAYLNYCRRVIRYFNPDFFAFGIEVNLVRKASTATWANYLQLHGFIYTRLKTEFPDLPIFASVVGVPLLYAYEGAPAEFNGTPDPAQAYMDSQRAALAQILAHSDYYAISFYPYASIFYNTPFPANMIPTLLDLSTKPLAIAETGILAQDLSVLGFTLIGSEARQHDYFDQLIGEMKKREGKFIINFVPQDYDQLCIDLGGCGDAIKVWMNTGFYSETGSERSVLQMWRSNL
ncbi:MAG: hypothetical protein ABL958_09130, partial [Bdellovibrionia bacterium]